MNNFKRLIVVLISLFIHETLCDKGVYISNNTMFDSIILNCPLLNTFNQSLNHFQNQEIFVKCKNWQQIKSITSSQQFNEENIKNIRCLLYYETFLSFCKDLALSLAKDYGMIFAESISENITTVEIACNNLSLLPKIEQQNMSIRQIIKDEQECRYLCSEYNQGVLHLNIMCAKSYYYNNLKLANASDIVASEKIVTLGQKMNTTTPQRSEKESLTVMNKKPTASIYDQNSKPQNKTATTVNIDLLAASEDTKKEPIDDGKYISQNKALPTDNINVLAGSEDTNVLSRSKALGTDKMNKPPLEIPSEDVILEVKNKDSTETFIVAENTESPYNLVNEQNDEKQMNINNELVNNIGVDVPIITPDNEEHYDRIVIHEQKEKDATQSEILGKISQQETISNTFESSKDDPFSESYSYNADMEGNSYFFTYFSFICVAFIIGYVGYHNKQKVVALLLEGRHSRRTQRDRRPNSANYHKLDTTLEEAISSSCSKNTSYVIY